MEFQGKPKPVSHNHTEKAPIPKPASSHAHSVIIKKNQLKEALGEFNEQEEKATHGQGSLLSDEHKVLHVGNEERGTIITDTKRGRWSLTDAVKGAVGSWYTKKQNQVEQVLKKPEPKKSVAAPESRKETIKKAADHSLLPKADEFKTVQPKKSMLGRKHAHSSVRIKEKNIPKEIGDTAPHWTHVVAEKKHAREHERDAQKPDAISTDTHRTSTPTKLIESPRHGRRLLEQPEDRKPGNVTKSYRPATNTSAVRVAGVSIAARPKPETAATKPTAPEKTPTRPEEKVAASEPAPAPEQPTPAATPTLQPAREPYTNNEPLTVPEPSPSAPDTPAIPIVTIVLVILFIVILAISTTLLGAL